MRVRLQAWHAGVYRSPGLFVSVGEEVDVSDAVGAELLRDFPGSFVLVEPEAAAKPKAQPKPEAAAKPKG